MSCRCRYCLCDVWSEEKELVNVKNGKLNRTYIRLKALMKRVSFNICDQYTCLTRDSNLLSLDSSTIYTTTKCF